ncbi:MAG: O-acetyl-ADP-ribose deacetylase [Nitrospiraceae bacterium]|nr:O-acetyl-ADP-ribose deacetylase [Nitrospiraceae bacterium]
MERSAGNRIIEVVQGDITLETVDAIVNAANSSLLGGGGVDGAIHRAGGPAILEECRALNGCQTGDAKITTGGRLPAKHVIHTVGPIYTNGRQGEPEALASCHRRSLEVAVEHGLKTVAFPAISCGVYGYPISEAAPIAIQTVAGFLQGAGQEPALARVRFVLFSDNVYGAFEQAVRACL